MGLWGVFCHPPLFCRQRGGRFAVAKNEKFQRLGFWGDPPDGLFITLEKKILVGGITNS